MLPGRPRAPRQLVRASKVDEAASAGFRRLYQRHPTDLLAFPAIKPIVQRASGADRPSRLLRATAMFCDHRLIGAYAVARTQEISRIGRDGLVSTRDTTPRPLLVDVVLPTLVPEYLYGWGPVVYQSTLDAVPGDSL